MSYPSGSGTFVSGSWGPGVVSGAGSSAIAGGSSGISVVTTAPGPASNQVDGPYPGTDPATYNYTHTIMSTQELINGTVENVPQQGVNAISNVTSVTLSGYTPTGFSSCSFVQWSGSWQSK